MSETWRCKVTWRGIDAILSLSLWSVFSGSSELIEVLGATSSNAAELEKYKDVASVLDLRLFILPMLLVEKPSEQLQSAFQVEVPNEVLPASLDDVKKVADKLPSRISNLEKLEARDAWATHKQNMEKAASADDLSEAKQAWKVHSQSPVHDPAARNAVLLVRVLNEMRRVYQRDGWMICDVNRCKQRARVSVCQAQLKELKSAMMEINKASNDLEAAKARDNKRAEASVRRDERREEVERKKAARLEAKAKTAAEKQHGSKQKSEATVKFAIFATMTELKTMEVAKTIADALHVYASQGKPVLCSVGSELQQVKPELQAALQEFSLELARRRASGQLKSLRSLKPVNLPAAANLAKVQTKKGLERGMSCGGFKTVIAVPVESARKLLASDAQNQTKLIETMEHLTASQVQALLETGDVFHATVCQSSASIVGDR
eukprot:6491537-Amphidinium_carterae.6